MRVGTVWEVAREYNSLAGLWVSPPKYQKHKPNKSVTWPDHSPLAHPYASRRTITCSLSRHVFHYIVEDGICYLCMTDDPRARGVPFSFLEDVKERYVPHTCGQTR